MKKLILFSLVLFSVAAAQEVWAKEKKQIISDQISLDGDAATSFWALYEEYQAKNMEIGKKRFAVLNDYINGYENIDDDLAAELMTKALSVKKERLDLWKEYFKKFNKSHGGRIASRFIQIENHFENVLSITLSDGLPFVGEDGE